MPAPLRFAVVGPAPLARWQADCIRGLVAAGEGELVALCTAAPAPRQRRPGVLLRLYNAMVRAACRCLQPADDGCAGTCAPRLPLDAMPSAGPLDFILSFTAEPALSAVAHPRLGVWSFHCGGMPATADELPGFRATAHGYPTVSIDLVAASGTGDLTPDAAPDTARNVTRDVTREAAFDAAGDAATILHSATIKLRRSHPKTVQSLLERAPDLCLGACRRVSAGVAGRPWSAAPALPPAGPLGALAGQARRALRGAAGRLFVSDVWTIGLADMTVDALLAGAPMRPRWLAPPHRGRFHADPFPLVVGDRLHVLFEMYDATARRGWIAAVPADAPGAGGIADARTALDIGCHMSYPSVLSFGGQTYMVPEVSAAGGLRLFRMGETAWDWTPVAPMLETTPLVDPTLFEHAGRWWLFATIGGPTSDIDLHAWHAPSPLGPWVPHALNPIKSDTGAARPAGAVFRASGRLLRPAQDCAEDYGRAIVLHEIVRLDPDGFEERALLRLEPGADWPFRDGFHTFNVQSDRIVIDAKRRQLAVLAPLRGHWRRRG